MRGTVNKMKQITIIKNVDEYNDPKTINVSLKYETY